MIDTVALRKRILDLAIQGLLTPDVTVDEGVKLKVNSILTENRIENDIDLSDIPYEIKNTWCWIKLGWIMGIERGGSPRPIKAYITDAEDGINWIKIGDVSKDGKYIEKTKEKIKPEGEKKSRHVYPGDFLLTNSMSFGRPYISKIDGCVHDGWLILRNTEELFDMDFLYHLLSSSYAYNQFSKKASGATVDNLNIDKVADAIIPLPPIEEQKTIVEKVEEMMQYIETIANLQTLYSTDLEVLKSKIIDAGIHGKLTEQLSEDGTADELMEQIRNKKDRMINEGLIPKESVSKKIGNEDMNFEIPQNWAYARVQDVATYITDYVANGSFATLKANTKTYKEPNYAVFVRTLDLGAQFCNELSYIDEASYEFLRKSKLYGGELILPNIGASIGKAFIMPDLGMPMSLAPNSVMVKFENNIMNKYFYYVFQSSYGKGILMNIQGGAATPKFSKTDLRKMIVMLPPLAEQERIVNRIEEIFALIQ